MYKVFILPLFFGALVSCSNGPQEQQPTPFGETTIEEPPLVLPQMESPLDPKIIGSWAGTYGYYKEFPFSDPDFPETDTDALATSLIISSENGRTAFCLAATQRSEGEVCSFEGTVSVLSDAEAVLVYKDLDDQPQQAVIKKSGNTITLDQVYYECGAVIQIAEKVTKTNNEKCEDAPDFLWRDKE